MQDIRSGWTGIHCGGDSLPGVLAHCSTHNAPLAQVGLNFGVRKEGLVVVRCQQPAKPSLLALNSRHNPPPPRRVTASDFSVWVPNSCRGLRTETRVGGFHICRNTTQSRSDCFHSPIFDLLTSFAASCMEERRKNQESRSATCSTGPTFRPNCVMYRISQPRRYLAHKKAPFFDHHRALGIDSL